MRKAWARRNLPNMRKFHECIRDAIWGRHFGVLTAAGDTFNLFDATTFNGTFASFQLPAVVGLVWDTSKVAVDGTISLVAVPQFTGIVLSGSTLTLSGTGGSTNGTYYLLG